MSPACTTDTVPTNIDGATTSSVMSYSSTHHTTEIPTVTTLHGIALLTIIEPPSLPWPSPSPRR